MTVLSKARMAFRPSSISLAWSVAGILGFALLTAIASKISFMVPGSLVPITLQSLVVSLAGVVLGSKRGALSQLSLIGLGLSGLPVFSAPLPGNLVLVGPTGGYILGFVLCAYATGLVFERLELKHFFVRYLAIFACSFFIFVPGVLWLSVYTGSFASAVLTGLMPFLLGGLLKCLAVSFASYAQRVRPRETVSDKG
jgi:biotin transport system substrate-specific component